MDELGSSLERRGEGPNVGTCYCYLICFKNLFYMCQSLSEANKLLKDFFINLKTTDL